MSNFKGIQEFLEEWQTNKIEEKFGDILSDKEIADHFGEEFKEETVKEDPNNLIAIHARIKNAATKATNASNLTRTGNMLCNEYSHVIKSFYDFSTQIRNKKLKTDFLKLIEKHELMLARLLQNIKNT